MKFKGTPGPWHWNNWGWLDGPDGADVLAYAGCGSHACEVSDEDAHLIEAAPELLLALQVAMALLRHNPFIPDSDQWEQMESAVNKALGAEVAS